MDHQLKETLSNTLDAIDHLLKMFQFERFMHLVVGVVSFVMLIYAIVLLFKATEVSTTLLVSLFGSSGLIAVSSTRITYFFNRAFALVEDVVRQALKL